MTASGGKSRMSFNRVCVSALFLSAFGFSAGCGALGNKDGDNGSIDFQTDDKGCLNEFGDNIRGYFDATIDEKKWDHSLKCVTNALKTFKKFARGSVEGGYNTEDVHTLMEKTLLTNEKVPNELVETTMELKASFFGGRKSVLTKDEVDRIIEGIELIRDRSTAVLPLLKLRKKDPTPENLLLLADALETVGTDLGHFLGNGGSERFDRNAANLLALLLNRIHDFKLDSKWINLFYEAKAFALGGSKNAIEPTAWERLLRATGLGGGLYLAYRSVDEQDVREKYRYSNLMVELGERGNRLGKMILGYNNGAISFERIDDLINQVPNDWIDLDREVVRKTYRTVFQKLLGGYTAEEFQAHNLEAIHTIYYDWMKAKFHLRKLFFDSSLSEEAVSAEDLGAAFANYKTAHGAEDSSVLERVEKLITNFRPVFPHDKDTLFLEPDLENSLHNLENMNFYNLIAKYLVLSYSEDDGHSLLERKHAFEIFDDYGPMALELKKIDYTYKSWPKKRFSEADMFTWGGNGDGFVNELEATYLIGSMASIVTSFQQVSDELTPLCRNGTGVDILDYEWMDMPCFRQEFFSRVPTFLENFPHFVEFYNALPPAGSSGPDKGQFALDLEKGSRQYGYNDLPIASSDEVNLLGVIHYMETAFARFDTNRNNRLGTQEVINAYPVYGKRIAELGNLDPDNRKRIRAVFAWLVKYGREPGDDVLDKIKYLIWETRGPDSWDINSSRVQLYKIASFFNEPEPLPETAQ